MAILNKKILLGILMIGLISALAGAGVYAYFSDTETSTGNVFTAGTIDINIDPTSGQPVTLDGFVDLKPCQTGYTTTTITNDGPNSATVWKHITNVENREHGITDAEGKYYAENSGSENWLISNWIHYDMTVYKPLDYSFSTTVDIDGSDSDLELTVEDDCGWLIWTFDFPIEEWSGDGNLNVGLIIALDGDGNGPAFQIHNNDGTDATYPWGTWLLSPWGPTIGDGWFGWHSSYDNTPVTDLDWVEASGQRNGSTDGVLTIKIRKCKLDETIHWAASPTVGSGFSGVYDVTMQVPTDFSWSTPIVDMSVPNYIEAPIMTLIKEIPESDNYYLTGNLGEGGVASKWIELGALEPGECICVIQSYHLDATVDNWGQSDRVFFDIEFLAQQTEGNPPAPGPVLGE